MKSLTLIAVAVLLTGMTAKAGDIKATVAELIRLNGYDCPAIRTITAEGNDHRGKVFKVWCGGHSGTSAWNVKAIEFKLVESQNPYNVTVAPWRE